MIIKITRQLYSISTFIKKNRSVLLCLSLFFLVSLNTTAQDNFFKIGCQYRLRPEMRHGYRTLATDTSKSAFFIGQRARLTFEYKQDFIHTYFSIQDGRTWGEEAPQTKGAGALQVNELWLELSNKKGFGIKMGRQELAYDDQRLLGNLDWGNLSKSHDALVLKYGNKAKEFNLHIGAGFNQSGEPLFGTAYAVKNYKFLSFLWLNKNFSKAHSSLSFIAIGHGLTSTDTISKTMKTSLTYGPLYTYSNKGWKASIAAYMQEGRNEKNQSLNAFMVNSYIELHKKKVLAGLGFDFVSGSSDKTSAKQSQTFNTLYGSNHKFYGYMDYFLNFSTDTKNRGLMDTYLKLAFGPFKNFTPMLDVHYFSLANEYSKKNIKKPLGNEFDLIIDYKPLAFLDFQVNYSYMQGSKSMEWLKGGDASNYNGWLYMILKVSPTLFMHEIAAKLKV